MLDILRYCSGIGFTGHRHLENETKRRKIVHEPLRAKNPQEEIVYGAATVEHRV